MQSDFAFPHLLLFQKHGRTDPTWLWYLNVPWCIADFGFIFFWASRVQNVCLKVMWCNLWQRYFMALVVFSDDTIQCRFITVFPVIICTADEIFMTKSINFYPIYTYQYSKDWFVKLNWKKVEFFLLSSHICTQSDVLLHIFHEN